MRLAAAVLVPPLVSPPPGVDPDAYREAMAADTYDVLDDLAGVEAYRYDGTLRDALHALAGDIVVVVSGDAPDLPGLLVGKLFSACEDRPAGVLPAGGGGLVGVAARTPVPGWLDDVTFDTDLDRLHALAPSGSVVVGPGWHRLRTPGDVARLDPRLDGWEATRALLRGR